jgi:hypothetical protein
MKDKETLRVEALDFVKKHHEGLVVNPENHSQFFNSKIKISCLQNPFLQSC